MTIATFLLSKLDFSAPKRWLSRHPYTDQAQATPSHGLYIEPTPIAMQSIACTAQSTRASRQKSSQIKPLRVVRVVEQGQARHHVGRMVISGSMADVCAELDRLAACELA